MGENLRVYIHFRSCHRDRDHKTRRCEGPDFFRGRNYCHLSLSLTFLQNVSAQQSDPTLAVTLHVYINSVDNSAPT